MSRVIRTRNSEAIHLADYGYELDQYDLLDGLWSCSHGTLNHSRSQQGGISVGHCSKDYLFVLIRASAGDDISTDEANVGLVDEDTREEQNLVI
jgi:hypothetical protein